MKAYFPDWYKKFTCIADKCPDSCCKEWDVVVDDESYKRYRNVDTDFGRKLNEVMEIDGDGDRIFTLQNGRCPFWNKDCLCDIYINLGEDALCNTCRKFPRIAMEYSDFEEHILSFACPEAARIMMGEKNIFSIECIEDDREEESCEYDEELMQILKVARPRIFEILSLKDKFFKEKIQECMDFFDRLSCKLYGDFYEETKIVFEYRTCETLNILSQLDVMTDEWKNILNQAKQVEICQEDIESFERYSEDFDYEFVNLAFYYIFRYFFNSVGDGDITFCINFLILAYRSLFALECVEYKQNGFLPFERRVRLFQLYSKEVEHSFENIEKLKEIN